MKWLPVLFYVGIAVWEIGTHFDAIWPQDPMKREAVRLCFAANHHFSPLDDAARDACMHKMKSANILTVEPAADRHHSDH